MKKYDAGLSAQEVAAGFFRRYRNFQILVLAISFILITLFFANYWGSGSLLVFYVQTIALVAVVYLVRYVFSIYQLKLITNIHDVDLDPVKYVDIYKTFKESGLFRKQLMDVSLNIAHGLNTKGDHEGALGILDSIDIAAKPTHLKTRYYYSLAIGCSATGDFERVEHARAALLDIFQKLKTYSAQAKYAQRSLDIIDARLAEHNGQLDEAMGIQNVLLLTAKFPIQVVVSTYCMARLYFEQGDYANAKSRCEFVIENGNTLYCVEESRKMLAQCDSRMTAKENA